MERLHLIHLILICLWAGLVTAETIIEFAARDEASMRVVARLHYLIDVLAEAPLLVGVLITGVLLMIQAWPLSYLHWIKIGAGLIAIGSNLYCEGLVIRRNAQLADIARLRQYHRRIIATGAGVPFALVAAYMGLMFFRR